ncbi:MAG: tRNA uridine-5-carboxymethylaminomethyl(34) synthesis GTPase MnmE [Erysipelotrichia bacterium]|jgi:tRNA modification GTPase|nr:tRNA uridine-5-carboxymethylaminomethyl(34) synthesis GTPase MnmE [Bacilli bacterium]MDD4005557.1 tRNA uridine-5-carboxymethylaminomethyl(34) synthesis GTPase MnmE [Bacilli bacterium]NMV82156.1 tRNA uridine-5-carboxymethylaminomethyl(34) synthesis GTPase MnmE [Erysipelotrichia bacterium]
MHETIVALATPPLKSALAVIRLSGDDCFDVVSKVFNQDISKVQKREVFIGKIVDKENVVDEVVLIAYVNPKSFTGENAVEIISHGSMLIVDEIIELLIASGARLALNGEFSSRAFLNNKIDLIQAEAINDLINSKTREAKKISMYSLQGKTSNLVWPIKKEIADLLSQIEVNIDYPEYEDIEEVSRAQVISVCTAIVEKVTTLIHEGQQGQIIKEGIKVAIVGKPNVGKSSLLNAMIGQEKAIVTNIPGTTRDIVEGEINLKGITLQILDTAGIREVNNEIESIGISKAKKATADADLVILVVDATEKDDDAFMKLIEDKKHIVVYNKSDIVKNKKANSLYISALNKDIDPLMKEIIKVLAISEEAFEQPSLNNTRQLGLLGSIKENLLLAIKDAENDQPIDLVSVSLLGAYNDTLEILGEGNKNDISEEIFSRFCVGK